LHFQLGCTVNNDHALQVHIVGDPRGKLHFVKIGQTLGHDEEQRRAADVLDVHLPQAGMARCACQTWQALVVVVVVVIAVVVAIVVRHRRRPSLSSVVVVVVVVVRGQRLN
jgi:hypothetical protein